MCVCVSVCVSGTGKVTQLVRGFNSDWKKAIELINQDVMRSFTNFKNGTQIMQVQFSALPLLLLSVLHNTTNSNSKVTAIIIITRQL